MGYGGFSVPLDLEYEFITKNVFQEKNHILNLKNDDIYQVFFPLKKETNSMSWKSLVQIQGVPTWKRLL